MKKLIKPLLVVAGMLLWASCSDDANVTPSDEAAGKNKPTSVYDGSEVSSSVSSDGKTLTININQAGRSAVSHLLLQVESCAGNALDPNDIINSTINGEFIDISDILGTTGKGTDCAFEGTFIKFDNISIQGEIELVIEFNTQIKAATLKIKASTACSEVALGFTPKCDPNNGGGDTETAFAKAPNGVCFTDLGINGRWGWSNAISAGYDDYWPVYAGAGQCDLSKGTEVGTVHVVYDGTTVTVTYHIDAPYTLEDTHVYAGLLALPLTKKGEPTVAAGQYTVGTFNGEDIYVIAHAVVGGF